MDIQRIDWQDGQLDIRALLALAPRENAALQGGIATFPAGLRHPPEGLSAHAQAEVSIILDGSFEVETADGVRRVEAHDLVVIPAGEPHATTALADARVFYILFG